jgi:alkylhydroperoxidase family enzyme
MFDPIFTPRERAALEMATVFTENYKDFDDEDMARWKAVFSDEEIIELAVFMALADGFGKVVEMLGLGQSDQVCKFEI